MALAPRWHNPLSFKNSANWIGTEAKATPEVISTYANWSRSYMQAMYNLNVAGQPHPDMSALPNQYDAEICKGNYAPRDTEQMNIIMTAINWGRMAIFADMGCGKTFMGGYAAMWWKKHSPQFQGSNKVTLVLCPKSVTSEWVNQCSQFFGSRVTVFPDNYYY